MLFIEVEPTCPVSCEDALRMLTEWQVSDRALPFYLKLMLGRVSPLLEALVSVAGQTRDDRKLRTHSGRLFAVPVLYLLATFL